MLSRRPRCPVRVVPSDAGPIRSLAPVALGRGPSLLVLGGQHMEQPDTLSVLPMPDEDQVCVWLVRAHRLVLRMCVVRRDSKHVLQ